MYLTAILIAAMIIGNFFWLILDQYPIEGHDLLGVLPAAQLARHFNGLENRQPLFTSVWGSYCGNLHYPPLSFLILGGFYSVLGLQGQMSAMINSLYIILILSCVYLLGKQLFDSKTGFFSALILSFFPGFVALSRDYWIEFGLIGYGCLNAYLLLKTDFFRNRKYSLMLGVSLALSFLHKQEFILSFIGPLILVCVYAGIPQSVLRLKKNRAITNFILALALPVILTSFWWGPYFKGYVQRIFYVSSQIAEGIVHVKKQSFLEAYSYYYFMIGFLIGLPYLFLFTGSLLNSGFQLIRKDKNSFSLWFLLFWFVGSYVIISSLVTKAAPHIFVLLPIVALCIGAAFFFYPRGFFRIVCGGIIIGMASYYYGYFPKKDLFILSYRQREKINRVLQQRNLLPIGGDNPWLNAGRSPRKERFEAAIMEVLAYIRNDKAPGEVRVLSLNRSAQLKNCIFSYYQLLYDESIVFFSYEYKHIHHLSECDYLLLEKKTQESLESMRCSYGEGAGESEYFNEIIKDGLTDFILVATIPIQDSKRTILIYKRKA